MRKKSDTSFLIRNIVYDEKNKMKEITHTILNGDINSAGESVPGDKSVSLGQSLMQSGVSLNSTYASNVESPKLPLSIDSQKRILGSWDGERGETNWSPDDDIVPQKCNSQKLTWREIKQIYGFEAIPFKSKAPDFSAIAAGCATIREFSPKRSTNFSKADSALAKQKTEIGHTAKEVRLWPSKNNYTWHECSDCTTMLLVPSIVHGNIDHTGGIGMEQGMLALSAAIKRRLGGRKWVLADNSPSGTVDKKEFDRAMKAHRQDVRVSRKEVK